MFLNLCPQTTALAKSCTSLLQPTFFSLNCLTSIVSYQEYIQDGIDWARVDFEDNQDCLNLFEKVNLLRENIVHAFMLQEKFNRNDCKFELRMLEGN